jgi:hypothetical protein
MDFIGCCAWDFHHILSSWGRAYWTERFGTFMLGSYEPLSDRTDRFHDENTFQDNLIFSQVL